MIASAQADVRTAAMRAFLAMERSEEMRYLAEEMRNGTAVRLPKAETCRDIAEL